MSSSNDFTLKCTNASFAQRQKDVFDQLTVLEKNRKNTFHNETPMETNERPNDNVKIQREVTKNFRGKESIFKKPQNPVPKNYINRIPDFKKNPHKWTRYSLNDVKDEDISDKGNTKAALSFLKELKDRKNKRIECIDEKLDELPTKITFRKHTIHVIPKPKEDAEIVKPNFSRSKVVMPEYVVGQKTKKEKRNRNVKVNKGKELKLDHLFENEDMENT